MNVTEIMSSHIVTVELDDTLAVVKAIFDNMKFHHLLVVDNDELIGIISDRDLWKALSPNLGTNNENYKDLATLNKKVHQIMSRHPIVLNQNATINDVIDLFIQHRISCIPIVGEKNRPVGIISWRDVIKKFPRVAEHQKSP